MDTIESELERLGFSAEAPETAQRALSAMTAAQSGETQRALESIAQMQQLSPRAAWPALLKALVLRGAGKLSGARDALGEAIDAKPSAWLHEQRARVWEDLGDLPRALEDAGAALAACPCEEHRLYKAHLHTCWREYDLAAEEYGRALLEDPNRPDLLFQRSKMYSTLGKLKQASADAKAALNLQPESEDLAFWDIQLEVLLGDEAAARDRLLEFTQEQWAEAIKAKAYFYIGYLEMFAHRWERAVEQFDKCLSFYGASALKYKAEFYRATAKGIPSPAPASQGSSSPDGRGQGEGESELYLLGLGVNPPFTATLESLRAVGKCEVVFNNVTGEEMFELLRIFCRDVRPLAYHQNDDEERLAREILAEVRPGRSVGFVTRGHATVYGGLGRELVARCIKEKHSFQNVASMSSADLFAAHHGVNETRAGMLVLDGAAASKTAELLQPGVPLVLYVGSNMEPGRYLDLCHALEEKYGAAHPCLVFDHRVDQVPQRLRMDGVAKVWEQLSPSAIFYVPGKS